MCAAVQPGGRRTANPTPSGEPMRRQGGFTYLMLLWWVALSGIMLMALAQRWSTEARRHKEMELVFRGEQIRLAIEAYAKVPVEPGQSPLPTSLDELVADRRDGTVRHHLRRLWPDPITGSPQWGLVQDPPVTPMGKPGIRGVYSLSAQRPLRAPPGVASYTEWAFLMGQPQPGTP